MKNQRRAAAKRKRELRKRAIQLRPGGGPKADGNTASSLASRQRDFAYLMMHQAPAPEWY